MNDVSYAMALARALEQGVVAPDAVVSWADSVILRSESPSPALCDLSTASDPNQLLLSLNEFIAQADGAYSRETWRAVLGHFHAWYIENPKSGRRITRALYNIARDGLAPDAEAEREMLSLDDLYDLAAQGTFGTVEQVEANLRELLERFAPAA